MSKKGFGKHDNALRMRDAIVKVVRNQLDILRPESRVGTVIDFDPVAGEVTALFPGDEDAQLVACSQLMMPSDVDQLVRVSGKPGSYFVTDIVDGYPWSVSWGGAPGDMKFWPAMAIPPKAEEIWLPCDGRMLDQVDYPKLYTRIGDSYTDTASGTTFQIPDMRRRFPRGADSLSGGTYVPGKSDGTADPLSRTINHSHTITAAAVHNHGAGTLATGSTSDRAAGSLGRATTAISGQTGDDGNHSHGGSTGATVAADFPWLSVNYLIKVL